MSLDKSDCPLFASSERQASNSSSKQNTPEVEWRVDEKNSIIIGGGDDVSDIAVIECNG